MTEAVNLGLSRINVGDYRQAASLFADVVRQEPGRIDALLYLGSCHNALGNYAGAIECFESLLRLQPGNAHALTYLGAAQQYLGRHFDAEASYRRALALKPDLADAQCNLGRLLLAGGDVEEARVCLEAAVRLQEDHQVALCGLAMLDEKAGRPLAGLARLLPFVERGEAGADIVITTARLCRASGDFEASLGMLSALVSEPLIHREHLIQGRFALGRSYDGLGRYEQAWRCFDEANRLKEARYDQAGVETAVNRVIDFFSEDRLAGVASSAIESEQPVFVIGLPRAGKSLLETMLDVHPAIAGRGELTRLGEISTQLGRGGLAYPEALAVTDTAQLAGHATDYLEACGALGQGVTRTIDTLPGNFLHVGLISVLFPRARIIWCRRNLLDTALYCFFKNFSGESLSFSFSQEDIAHYFTHFSRLMTHWQSVFVDRMHIVDYESLVNDSRHELTAIFEYLGVDDELESEPPELHDREIEHYRHYREWIEPLVAGLGAGCVR